MATGARQSAVAKVAASKKRNITATASSLRFGFNVSLLVGQRPGSTNHLCNEEAPGQYVRARMRGGALVPSAIHLKPLPPRLVRKRQGHSHGRSVPHLACIGCSCCVYRMFPL